MPELTNPTVPTLRIVLRTEPIPVFAMIGRHMVPVEWRTQERIMPMRKAA